MAYMISKPTGDGQAITRVGTSFPKNSTFDYKYDYVIVQDKKIVGSTGKYCEASKQQLNKKCFSSLKAGFFGPVKADVYAMQKSMNLTPRVEDIKITGHFPRKTVSATEVIANFRLSLSVNDPTLVYKKLIEMPGGTSYPSAALIGVFKDLAMDTFDVMLKNMDNRPRRLVINYFSKDKYDVKKFFDEFNALMIERFKTIGYDVKIIIS